MESAGYDVLDLGRNVPAEKFVDSAVEFGADIIAISTLMTTTMENMGDVVRLLVDEGIRKQFKVIIGGKPVSAAFAKKIGADFYSSNAPSALRLVGRIMEAKRKRQG